MFREISDLEQVFFPMVIYANPSLQGEQSQEAVQRQVEVQWHVPGKFFLVPQPQLFRKPAIHVGRHRQYTPLLSQLVPT